MSFIKMVKSRKTNELIKDRNAFALLAQIALRAKRTNDFSVHGLEIGEALIGDYKSIGLTERKYRTAKAKLREWGFVTTKATNKGTIAKLINSEVFDINEEAERRPKRQDSDEQETTNKKEKNEKRIYSSENQVPYQAIVGLFNEIFPGFPTVQKVTDTRKKHLRARWNTSSKTQSVEWWKNFFGYIRESEFLMGQTNDPFKCNFDWIINESNFVKIFEGNYHK
jgi:hypothetical protein